MITELGKQLVASIPTVPFEIARAGAILGPALRQFIDQGVPFEKKEFQVIQKRRKEEEKERGLFTGL